MSYTVNGFFAGAGGIEIGFEEAGFWTKFSVERDKYAVQTLDRNQDTGTVLQESIENLDPNTIPDATVWTAGFPCQPFSIAGAREGFKDSRGNAFFDLMKLVAVHKPRVLFLENVKNLVTHDGGNTFRVILDTLRSQGYNVTYAVLNSQNYGVPQVRERIYIVAFLEQRDFDVFCWPLSYLETVEVKDVLEPLDSIDPKYFYTEGSTPFHDMLEDAVTEENTAYQWRRKYVRENKSGAFPTLTANRGTGGHNVPIVLQDGQIRKLTPRECFRVQGYPEWFALPNKLSNAQAYKQAGNSVAVPVITAIANEIYRALEMNK